VDEEGQVITPPEDGGFVVTAATHDGTEVGYSDEPPF
jgi:hypothetical protein